MVQSLRSTRIVGFVGLRPWDDNQKTWRGDELRRTQIQRVVGEVSRFIDSWIIILVAKFSWVFAVQTLLLVNSAVELFNLSWVDSKKNVYYLYIYIWHKIHLPNLPTNQGSSCMYFSNSVMDWSSADLHRHTLRSEENRTQKEASLTTSLVGGIPTPLKNDGVRQLGWLFHSQYDGKVISTSHVPVTTKQFFVGPHSVPQSVPKNTFVSKDRKVSSSRPVEG